MVGHPWRALGAGGLAIHPGYGGATGREALINRLGSGGDAAFVLSDLLDLALIF
jgi:hypothetical protein